MTIKKFTARNMIRQNGEKTLIPGCPSKTDYDVDRVISTHVFRTTLLIDKLQGVMRKESTTTCLTTQSKEYHRVELTESSECMNETHINCE